MRSGTRVHPGWLVAAVVVAVVAAPIGAVAATQLVKITGSSGKVAQVDPANRLQVAESSPRAYFDSGYPELDQTLGCQPLVHVPGTKAFVATQISVFTKGAPTFDADHGVIFFAEPGCAGAAVFIDVPTGVGTELFTLDPPLPIPAGGILSGQAFGPGTHTEVEVRGYFVPKSAVS